MIVLLTHAVAFAAGAYAYRAVQRWYYSNNDLGFCRLSGWW